LQYNLNFAGIQDSNRNVPCLLGVYICMFMMSL